MADNVGQIRKIAVGQDYKNHAMHYIVGQKVLSGYQIQAIIEKDKEFSVWAQSDQTKEIVLWKRFNSNMPISIEYNIDF